MKNIDDIGFQGDVCFIKVNSLPSGCTKVNVAQPVVAHSETGHHHVASGGDYYTTSDPFVAYLVAKQPVRIEHRRDFDTHETIQLLGNDEGETIWEIRRQREYTSKGDRLVMD